MPAPIHWYSANSLSDSDLQQSDFSPGHCQILQNSSEISHQPLSSSSSSATTTTDFQFNDAMSSNSTNHITNGLQTIDDCNAVPSNIYNGNMYSVNENPPPWNGCINPSSSSGYPAYGSLYIYSNGLVLSHNGNVPSNYGDYFTKSSNNQTCGLNKIKSLTFNGCNDWSASSYPNDWSSYNNYNSSASNGHNVWSPSLYSTYNSWHPSLMDHSRNTSLYHGYSNGQNLPFFSDSVSGPSLTNCYDKHNLAPVNGTNSLCSSFDSTDYNMDKYLSEQLPQTSSHSHNQDINNQNNIFLSSKPCFQTSQIFEYLPSNNIYQDPCETLPPNKVCNCGVLPSVCHIPTKSFQTANLSGVEKKSQKKGKGKRNKKTNLKEKDERILQNLYFRAESNEEPVVSVGSKTTSYRPKYQRCGLNGSSDSTSLQEPVQRLNTAFTSSSSCINGSKKVSTATRINPLSTVESTASLSGGQLIRANIFSNRSTLPSDIPITSKNSTANKRSATTIWKKLLDEVRMKKSNKLVNRQAGSKNDIMLVKILNHERTQVYFGSREKPAQIPSFNNHKPTRKQSLNVPTDTSEAEYVEEVKRFHKIQESKKSLLEQLLQ